MLLEGKHLLVTGVLTQRSIAYAVAEGAQREGAEVLLTGFGRGLRITERIAGRLPRPAEVLELDVNEPDHVERIAAEIDARWGRLDGILHAIAFAPPDALGGGFLDTPRDSAELAFRTSAYSLKALASGLRELLSRTEGDRSIVALDFDASVAWPAYDWMGVAKAALESVSRYLARDMGPEGVRVNLVAAGPIRTTAARSIPGFDELADGWQARAPLAWDEGDPAPVADACLYLLSERARAITGTILHADGGAHAMGAPASPSAQNSP